MRNVRSSATPSSGEPAPDRNPSDRSTPGHNTRDARQAAPSDDFALAPPTISLPKGGGALRGIGEKFAANPVTGTASLQVPIATSPGRGGFGPTLGLAYDSGSGNGPFGFGWSLSLPAISRKTDKGLPEYRDAAESDVFLIAGAEDLVPVIDDAGERFVDDRMAPEYEVHRYRPRVEGLFARIERWTRRADGDVHWRVITRDNVVSFYGRTSASRVHDPDDPRRVFSWLLCESYDNKGNAIVYEYAAEDAAHVDVSRSSERTRVRGAGRYLKSIKYGNRRPVTPESVAGAQWLFEVVFDYDEAHVESVPFEPSIPIPDQHPRVRASYRPAAAWPARPDAFSSYRSGFEVRTHRRCRRVLMFHLFDELTEAQLGEPYLVGATEFEYDDLEALESATLDGELHHQGSTRFASFLRRVFQTRFMRDDSASELVVDRGDARYVTYLKRSLPPVEFDYSKAAIQDEVRVLDAESADNLPHGVDGSDYRWVDLDGEGLSGILSEHGGAWFYKRNLGEGRLGPMMALPRAPAVSFNASGQQLADLSGDGQLDLVAFDGALPGYFERTADGDWSPFRSFEELPRLDWNNPNLRLVDLDGDGHADVLITEDDVFTWYPSLEERGFDGARQVRQPPSDDGARLLFADGTQSVYLADFVGDGLTDLVRIRNGEVCYWPNLGYGRFGAKVVMDNAPRFDGQDQFDQKRIRLADVDGSGTVDILYLHRDGVRIYFNQSGNRWTEARPIRHLPPVDDLSSIAVADLLGNGTACLVWSSALPGHAQQPLRYLDLMGGQKPHLLVRTRNNLGAETEIEYRSSTHFYLADERAGQPWVTKLPFPVHCVVKVTVSDRWRQTRFSTSYSYHHGYFDGHEREFRGFGRVEQVDTESFGRFAAGNAASPYITDDRELYQPPIKTVTWFHTGALLERGQILRQYEAEYFPNWLADLNSTTTGLLGGFEEYLPPEPDLAQQDLTTAEYREALRACKGIPLRQEIYELDVDALELEEERPVKLFSATHHNCHIRRLQPRSGNRHAVFLITEAEALSYQYEIDLRTETIVPDPRVTHTLNLLVDELGNVLQSVSVAYPRSMRQPNDSLPTRATELIHRVQSETHLAYTESRFTNDVDERDHHRSRVPYEVKVYSVTGLLPEDTNHPGGPAPRTPRYFSVAQLRSLRLSNVYQSSGALVHEIEHHRRPNHAVPEKRIIEHARTLYFDERLVDTLPLGRQNRFGLTYEAYKLALTEDFLSAIFEDWQLTPDVRASLSDSRISGYLSGSALLARFPDRVGEFWVRSGSAGFRAEASELFYIPDRYTDAFGNATQVQFDGHLLWPTSITDPLGNTFAVRAFDYRTLAPREVQDANHNLSEALFDTLGRAVAIALKGKGDEGDTLSSFDIGLLNPTLAETQHLFTGSDYDARTRDLLRDATVRHVYSFGELVEPDGRIRYEAHPAGSCDIFREEHVARLRAGQSGPLQLRFEYTDGHGKVLVAKVRAEPEDGDSSPRWLATGQVLLNNKGKPVRQYEPYFSPSAQRFEEAARIGVASAIWYDAADRVIRTQHPDGSYSRVEYTPWRSTRFDANDTLLEPGNGWYAARTAEGAAATERAAALEAAQHARTPDLLFTDSLGREVVSVVHNKYRDRRGVEQSEKHVTFTRLDTTGKPLYVRDARMNLVVQHIAPPLPSDRPDDPTDGFVSCYDIVGNLLRFHGMDSGERWMLPDAAGQALYTWDVNDRLGDDGDRNTERRVTYTEHDTLRRPTNLRLQLDGGAWRTVLAFEYGEALSDSADARARNLRGRLRRQFDPSGMVGYVSYDFKGFPLELERQLVRDATAAVIDWSTAREGKLEAESYRQHIEYDALSRVVRLVNWHRDATRSVVYEYGYNERGLLVQQRLLPRAGTPVTALFGIQYNAKGQRVRVRFGNGTATRHYYDPTTFRLMQVRTTRSGYEPPFPTYRSNLSDSNVVQQLSYTYDAVGNITDIYDEAYEPAFFGGQEVNANSHYRYDSLYRLVAATGRENAEALNAPTAAQSDSQTSPFPHPPGALRNYEQHFEYDAVGNLLELAHQVPGVPAAGSEWTRTYEYETTNNRLSRSWLGSRVSEATRYHYDRHGNMGNLANVAPEFHLRWDHRDMVRAVNRGGGGWVHYNYDADKRRTRKIISRRDGSRQWERIYLGELELYRSFAANGDLEEEIETHHVWLGSQRAIIVDDVITTQNPRLGRGLLYRYQYGNHLGSVALEMDASAAIVSYEEYHPYGTSAYRAQDASIRATRKRYRYSGMERDEETSLSYHSARHYVPWLGRWCSCDPNAARYAPWSAYAYALDSPLVASDPQGTDVVIFFEGAPFGEGLERRRTEYDQAGPAGRVASRVIASDEADGQRDHDYIVIAPGATSESSINTARAFAQRHLSPGERLIVYGFSRGGAVAVDFATAMGESGTDVNLLITVDAAYGPLSDSPGVVDRTIPDNVEINVNYFQRNFSEDLTDSHGAPNVADEPDVTRIFNYELSGTSHGTIGELTVDTVVANLESYLAPDVDPGWHPAPPPSELQRGSWTRRTAEMHAPRVLEAIDEATRTADELSRRARELRDEVRRRAAQEAERQRQEAQRSRQEAERRIDAMRERAAQIGRDVGEGIDSAQRRFADRIRSLREGLGL